MSIISSGLGSSGGSYSIANSVRFRSSASAYFSRTFGTPTDGKKFTFSAWVKRGLLDATVRYLLGAGSTGNGGITLDSSGTMRFYVGGSATVTNALFRDPSAHFHVVAVLDTTQASNADRTKLYVNGTQLTVSSSATITQNSSPADIGAAVAHTIGTYPTGSAYFDGLLSDIYFIDGQALTPSSFGTTNTDGVWVPKAYTGTYGNNGFYLDFKDGTSVNTLGNDRRSGSIVGTVPPDEWLDGDLTGATAGVFDIWYTRDFGSAVTPTEFKLVGATTRGTNTNGGTGGCAVEYSDDGSTWYSAASQSGVAGVGSANFTITLALSSGAHRYWRWKGTNSFGDSSMFLAESKWTGVTINSWVANNLSTTAGVTYDWMTDTPTANYATLNPLAIGAYGTLSNANTRITGTSSTDATQTHSTIGVTTGKWYYEVQNNGGTYHYAVVEEVPLTASKILNPNFAGYRSDGSTYSVSAGNLSGRPTWTTSGDVIGVAIDCDNGAVYFAKNNTWITSGDPTSGASRTGAITTWTGGSKTLVGGGGVYQSGSIVDANFGQRPFTYTPPTGFKALCTSNLPAVAITNPKAHFDAKTYVGSGATNNVTGLQFQPDLVWIKNRPNSGGYPNVIQDAVRGAQKQLRSDSTNAETSYTDQVTSFNSDGFTLFAANSWVNQSPDNYVSWNWKSGGVPTTDNVAGAGNVPTAGSVKIDGVNLGSALAGSVAATRLSANTTAGFSIVTYTPAGASGTIGHGLGSAPALIIAKPRDSATYNQWRIYHKNANASPATGCLFFDTSAFTTSGVWNNTAPTSSVFSIQGGGYGLDQSGIKYVAYCFAEIEGFSKFGSYVGNGATGGGTADGVFVYTGFRPRFVLVKCSSGSGSWYMEDSARDTYNYVQYKLAANGAWEENNVSNIGAASEYCMDFLANGFKLRHQGLNASSTTYIFAAFAEYPFGGSNVAPAPAR